MSILAWIIAASLVGGVLSVACAALFALTARAAWVPMLVSYAIGALLGAAFLELLPHAGSANLVEFVDRNTDIGHFFGTAA